MQADTLHLSSGTLILIELVIAAVLWVVLRGLAKSWSSEGAVDHRVVLALSSISALVGGLCCLTPIVLVLVGVASVSVASSLGNVLYGDYRWLFRLASLLLTGLALAIYFRNRGVCTLQEVKRRRSWLINVSLLVLVTSTTAYIFWTYVVLQYWGIAAGLPWAQYDESWAIPTSAALAAFTILLFLIIGRGRKPGPK